MRFLRRTGPVSKRALVCALGVCSAAAAFLTPGTTQNAIANGDTRTINLYHTHTRESIQATFMRDGRYDQAVLEKLNWFLRDWRLDEPIKMDPRLFDTVWETYRASGSTEPVHIVSAYRSPRTNAMLRRRSKAVAEHSQHMLGKAMDMHYVDVPMSRIRELGMKLQRGGVGYYPSAGSPFVHLDVGSVRAWPRMTYDQLARLFPDGKTVHLPSNGQPLARYEEARAEILARNGGSSIPTMAEVKSKSIFASLFGWGDDEEQAAPPPGPRSRLASAVTGRNARGRAVETESDMEPPRSAPIERAERNLPRGETFMQPADAVATAAPATRSLAAPEPKVVAAVIAPIPPRRPSDLGFASLPMASMPLPPVRPAELVRSQVADARATTTARPGELPSVITTGTRTPVGANAAAPLTPAGLLAYAPQPQAPASNPAAVVTDAPMPPIRSVALRPSLAPPAQAVGIRAAAAQARKPQPVAAARLDRSNFRVLTSPTQIVTHVPTGLGAAAAPVRAAARTDLMSVAFSSKPTVVSRFAQGSVEVSNGFSGPAVQPLPRLDSAALMPARPRDAVN